MPDHNQCSTHTTKPIQPNSQNVEWYTSFVSPRAQEYLYNRFSVLANVPQKETSHLSPDSLLVGECLVGSFCLPFDFLSQKQEDAKEQKHQTECCLANSQRVRRGNERQGRRNKDQERGQGKNQGMSCWSLLLRAEALEEVYPPEI